MRKEIYELLDEMFGMEDLTNMFEEEGRKTEIYVNKNHVEIKGSTPALLALYTRLTKCMTELKGSSKELVKDAFDMAFKTDEELNDEVLKEAKELLEKLKKELEENKDE